MLGNPQAFSGSNLSGFVNVIEACRSLSIDQFIFASFSSVYGQNLPAPMSEKQRVDKPLSLSTATKQANELIAHSYSHFFEIYTTGLGFIVVYETAMRVLRDKLR